MGEHGSDCTLSRVVIKPMFAMLLSAAFVACSQNNTHRLSETTGTNSVKPLYANSVTRHFSNESQKDTLNVAVNGESLITGEVYLQITNPEGKSIFSTTFPASALLNHSGLINPKQDEKTIKNRIDDFFQETHFVTTVAAKPNLSTMTDSTKAAWQTVLTDPAAVCFSYQGSKGNTSQIAYSKALRKVVQL